MSHPRPAIRLRAAIVCLAFISIGCARSWPDEVPSATSWQIRSAPLMELSTATGIERNGILTAAFVYSSDWNERPREAADPSLRMVQLPSRLDVVCRDAHNDTTGKFEVVVVPSEPILRRWHPRNWSTAHLVFASNEGRSEPIPVALEPLISGAAPFVEGPSNVAEVLKQLKAYSTQAGSSVALTASFEDVDRPPLTITFPLDELSQSYRLQLVYEQCGEIW